MTLLIGSSKNGPIQVTKTTKKTLTYTCYNHCMWWKHLPEEVRKEMTMTMNGENRKVFIDSEDAHFGHFGKPCGWYRSILDLKTFNTGEPTRLLVYEIFKDPTQFHFSTVNKRSMKKDTIVVQGWIITPKKRIS